MNETNLRRLILLRHGETEANVARIWHGALDAPLTQRGLRQVAAAAERLAGCHGRQPIQLIYSSPLPRARRTAELVAAAIGLPVQEDAGLREFDLGDWEGRTFDDLRRTEQLWQRWDIDPHFAPPNGESPFRFHQRAVAAVTRLAAAHPQETLLLVTHGGIICHVLAHWLGNGPTDWRRWDPHNGALTVLTEGAQGWQPLRVNDISHLPPEALAQDLNADEPVLSQSRSGQSPSAS